MSNHNGYAFLPPGDKPTSNLTYRLNKEELAERNEWIFGAFERKMPIEEIAHEVGLSVSRVKQILKPSPSRPKAKDGIVVRPAARGKNRASIIRGNTPLDKELRDFWLNYAHPACAVLDEDMCNHCYGEQSIILSCYDKDGLPYAWALSKG